MDAEFDPLCSRCVVGIGDGVTKGTTPEAVGRIIAAARDAGAAMPDDTINKMPKACLMMVWDSTDDGDSS